MKLLKFKLRGAIGIWKGQGKDEIEEIDFTKFGPGLVAITGKNGAGKSTILECLHPYRTMVSREGSLQSHFRLRDSYKILSFEQNGKVYESKILIDALTGGSEAYLFENGVALNDGKLTTYDAEIEKVLGSQDLFFNSVFSGQKSKGIAQLKPAERRKLFYELLNLNVYDSHLERAKAKMKTAENDLLSIEAEIRNLQEQNNEVMVNNDSLIMLEAEKKAKEAEIKRLAEAIASHELKIRELELAIAKMEEGQKRNQELTASGYSKSKELDKLINTHKYGDLPAIERDKEFKVKEFDESNAFDSKINTLLQDRVALNDEEAKQLNAVDAEIRLLGLEQTRLCSNKDDYQKLTVRNEKLLDNKALIQDKLQQKKGCTEKIARLSAEKSAKNQEIANLTGKKAEKESILSEKRITLNDICSEALRLSNEHIGYEKEIEALNASHAKEVARIQADMDMIPRVACTGVVIEEHPELKGCIAVKKAYESAATLPEVKQAYEAKVSAIESDMSETRKRIDAKGAEKKALEEEIRQIELEIANNFTSLISKLKVEIAEIDRETMTLEQELSTLNTSNWEKMERESQEAENEIKVLQEKIKGVEDKLVQTSASIAKCIVRKDDIERATRQQVNKLAEQISSLRREKEEAREAIVREYDIKTAECKVRFEEDKKKLEAEIDELWSKIDKDLDNRLMNLQSELKLKKEDLELTKKSLAYEQGEMPAIDTRIAEVKAQLQAKEANLRKIEALQPRLTEAQQQVKDWAFLVKAFDKTGIPVLKLENSGYEITAIANDLLSIFDSKFRIVFETTKLTADKKKMKETFDINVIENDGVCEISNKSGGQQVWIETGIRLAVSRIVRKQGKNIQTTFLDESDGALDMENAFNFYEMLRRNHENSGVHNTFLITHRPELLDYIPQQIRLENGRLEVVS